MPRAKLKVLGCALVLAALAACGVDEDSAEQAAAPPAPQTEPQAQAPPRAERPSKGAEPVTPEPPVAAAPSPAPTAPPPEVSPEPRAQAESEAQQRQRLARWEAERARRLEELQRLEERAARAPEPGARNGEGAEAPLEPDHAVVEVFYATDRDRSGDPDPRRFYGGDRGSLRYGLCRVSIPREHRMGALESPSIWRLEFRQNPAKHVVLLALEEHSRETYLSRLAARVRASGSKAALLFVHGYNVTFEDAARRTAQLHYDLGFDGAPVFYSWPSRGEFAAYPVDETNVQWTHVHLVQFLSEFVAGSDAEHIYVIAHSMGNRAVTRALSSYLQSHREAAARFREIILTAPDIDADVFRQEIAPGLAAFGAPITLYASSRDKALLASKTFHGYARAGDAGAGLVVVPGIDTIDASAVDTSLLGHSYYGDARSVLSDLYYLVRESKRPPRFSLEAVETADGSYWVFRP